ncbi:MAG: IS256 family transposase [Gammaproteobacteria bacterium]|nr:IS256 family transposase [Gammaproteobacteria bacterium]
MEYKFDMENALKDLRSGKGLIGKDGVLTPLIKKLSEVVLVGELEHHLSESEDSNRKNGTSPKTIRTGSGSFNLDNPRDRNGTFEPELIKKHQTVLTDEMDRKVLSMFGLGMSYRSMQVHLLDLYGVEISTGKLNSITDKLLTELNEWRNRPLDSCYPIVWLDAIHYKIKEEGVYANHAVYTLLGLNLEGKKEVLGLYLSKAEGAKHWLSVLTELKNRGVDDILIACIDGLKGFPEAIQSIYPKTEIQLCIIHQIRNSMKYVGSKNHKEFMADLKLVYRASSQDLAEQALDDLDQKWGKTYPIVIQSWRNKWQHLSAYFKYPEPIRKIIYTTNAVEAVHRQFRKLTKTKGAFPNENSLLKLLYSGILNSTKKWTVPVQNWSEALSQLAIYFDGRLDKALDI